MEDKIQKLNVKKIHHLGFVVRNLNETLKAWEELFGVKAEIKENPSLQVRLGAIEIANVKFVFNESTHQDSRWAKYLEENGEGLEHVAFEFEDIQSAVNAVNKTGLTLRFKDHNSIHGLLSNFVEGMHGTDVEIMGPEK
jgi:methylmalonyl-CoA/ethylmalonyl-CoA epimerase